MTCGGCSGAVTRVLNKAKAEGEYHCSVWTGRADSLIEGLVNDFDVSLEKQEVLVNGPISYDDLLDKIKKTGKEVRYLPGL